MESTDEGLIVVLRFGVLSSSYNHYLSDGVIPALDHISPGSQCLGTGMTEEGFTSTNVSTINVSNLALVGKEIVKFQSAELIDKNKYKLSNLIRGQEGTKEYQHTAGEKFVLLDDSIISFEVQRGKKFYLNADFKANTWDEVISGEGTYKDLNRTHGLAINGQKITNEFINNLYSKHKNLILRDENGKGNYRPFLRQIFTEMFKHVGATIPNNSIIEELINNYYQGGYTHFLPNDMSQALGSFHLSMQSNCMTREYIMDCREPNCIKLSFSMKYTKMLNYDDYTYIETPGFCSSAEFKLKCEDKNVTYEDGKVLLTIPKELKNYKVSGKNLFDVIVEYFQKLCEKLGFKFETKVEHSLGEPLKVVSEANASSVEDLKLKVNNQR